MIFVRRHFPPRLVKITASPLLLIPGPVRDMNEPAPQRWSIKRFVWVLSRSRGPISLSDENIAPGNGYYEASKTPRWARERSGPKLLILAKWLAISACAAYFIASRVSFGLTESRHVAAPSLCFEPECIHAASEILYNLDPHYEDIDPCDNIEQFICGGWRDRHDMRPDQGSIFAGTIMAENAQTRLRHILEASEGPKEETLSPADKDNFKKLKSAYDSCIDVEALKQRGTTPLDDLLHEIEKIYSIHGEQTQEKLTDAITFLLRAGVPAFTELFVSPDDRDPDSVVVFVTPPREIGLPAREYYNNTQTVKDYTRVVSSILSNFQSSERGGLSPLRLAMNVVLLEKKLADATPDTQAQEDVTQYYNPKSIEETESLVPQISFSKIISELGPKNYQPHRLIVGSPSYLKELSSILNSAPRVVVQAFFRWKTIQSYSDEIEHPKIVPLREFNNQLAGKDPQATEDRWRKCIRTLDSGIGWTLSRFYVLDSFPEASKKLGDQIVLDIKERFVYVLDQTKWMSPEVRQLGKQKVANIIQKIGYPTRSPDLMDADDVKSYYANLHIANDAFFENVLNMTQFEVERQWAKLGKPTNRDEWEMTTPTVNAYYNPPGNEIVFPAGIMQPPAFYGVNAPLYLAYGAFGAISGHELSHAFDSGGRHYDQIGNYTDWWDNQTVQAFEERTQCFIDQYSNVTVPGPDPDSEPLHVNGLLTLGENIADAGGLSAAYYSWKKHDDAHPDRSLPGLTQFTKDQLFFISYSNWWCGKTTKEQAIRAIYTDPHAPKSARISETLANSREFKEAFKCPTKEPICKLW
ncbi:endothelin-converting enzyme [Talaromyces proteolyticus]|uniref:Endothelin-converting enzyme n=1 Tax=Talaromyces proteolyticus TaxID=1131652 RepID=A0AAD4KNP4_9EURO|nr:endothelin-converting enzyme [Talaromyces proteolyticus]KAH8695544.1 endothelin-converting enzyme [Talaromyces proteolyticus]